MVVVFWSLIIIWLEQLFELSNENLGFDMCWFRFFYLVFLISFDIQIWCRYVLVKLFHSYFFAQISQSTFSLLPWEVIWYFFYCNFSARILLNCSIKYKMRISNSKCTMHLQINFFNSNISNTKFCKQYHQRKGFWFQHRFFMHRFSVRINKINKLLLHIVFLSAVLTLTQVQYILKDLS